MDELITALREILLDFDESYQEVFFYTTTNTFYLTEPIVVRVDKVTINDNELQTGESFSFDSNDNSVTITGYTFEENDVIKVFAKKNKYNNQELRAFLKRALLYIGIGYKNFDIDTADELDPTPTSEEEKLIILVATILAEPSYTQYSLPTVTVKYAETMSLEEKINSIINRYVVFAGLWDYVQITGGGAIGQRSGGFF